MSEMAARSLGGFLADRKTTYFQRLGGIDHQQPLSTAPIVHYAEPVPTKKLEDLAIQSGEYSRFNVDPRIPTERFEELYRTWIRKSVDRSFADAVMVVQGDDGEIAGMVTLGEKNGRGDIGLIAVNVECRGKGYGRALVYTALEFFRSKGTLDAQVVTQGGNGPACKLYEATGYSVEKQENYFHFWLG